MTINFRPTVLAKRTQAMFSYISITPITLDKQNQERLRKMVLT